MNETATERPKNQFCPFCACDTQYAKFRDSESQQEFKISGICQNCQDDFFSK